MEYGRLWLVTICSFTSSTTTKGVLKWTLHSAFSLPVRRQDCVAAISVQFLFQNYCVVLKKNKLAVRTGIITAKLETLECVIRIRTYELIPVWTPPSCARCPKHDLNLLKN